MLLFPSSFGRKDPKEEEEEEEKRAGPAGSACPVPSTGWIFPTIN